LRELERDVSYLELAGEGHEYRRVESRIALLRGLTLFLSRVLSAEPQLSRSGVSRSRPA
jgi:hypothetical protein